MPISKGEKIFNIINSIFLTAVALFCLAPMIYMLAVSLSDNAQVVAGNVTFWPKNSPRLPMNICSAIRPSGNPWGFPSRGRRSRLY